MSSFSIDDVRETFTADMTNLIGNIDRVSAELCRSPLLDGGASTAVPLLFDALMDSSHSIAGTSGLVAATSLHESARLLEALSESGRDLLRKAVSNLAEARRVATMCTEGAKSMRTMLELELDHRPDEALGLARSFAASARPPRASVAPRSGRPGDESAEPPSRRSQRPDTGPVSSRRSYSGAPEELVLIFREEAQELTGSLAAQIDALRAEPDDAVSLRVVERIYHTLKGAAATVGLRAVSEEAAALQLRVEEAVERARPVSPAFLSGLVEQTNRMLLLGGLDRLATKAGLSLASRPDFTFEEPTNPGAAGDSQRSFDLPDAGVDSELRGIFEEEAKEGIAVLEVHLRTLASQSTRSPASDRMSTLGHIERIFHTLKGAAATVRHEDARALAATLQRRTEELLETEGWSVPDAVQHLTHEVHRLEKLVGRPSGQRTVPPPPAVPRDAIGPARAEFFEETRQLCESARRLLTQLPAAAGREPDVRAELGRLFHRLRGSALVVMERDIAELAERLQLLSAGQGRLLTAEIQETLTRLEASVQATALPHRAASAAGAGLPGAPVLGAPRGAVVSVRETVSPPTDPEVMEVFHQECTELLDRLDRAILDLEKSDRPKHVLEGLTGVFHTLKGAVNAVGLAPVGQAIHRIEDLLEDLASAPILPPMRGVATLLLKVQSGIRENLVTAPKGYVETFPERLESQIARILAGGRLEGDSISEPPPSASAKEPQSSRDPGSGGASADPGGDRKYIRVGTERLDSLMNLAGELVVSRSRLMTRVQVLRKLQQGLSESRRRLLDTVEQFRSENEFSMLGRDGRSTMAPMDLRPTESAAPRDDVRAPGFGAFTELELDRYDDINILARALAEITDDVNDTNAQLFSELASFADDSDAFGTIVSGIQGEVTRARMVPLSAVFSRLSLPIRDAAERQGKEVRITTLGGTVSLDKSIADALFTPLLHLVRNAVYHGIEAPSARARAGKDATGELRLIAREESGQIVVEVHDDGAGLDLAALRARGVAMGLVRATTPLTDRSVRDLVFASRLSTAADVGAVAGRGVGGDVVRRAVERLNGNIRVESEAGKGTSFVARLPLTLAITRSLIVRHGGRTYAVPLHFAERILDVEETAFVESAGARRIKVDGAYLPLHDLGAILKLAGGAESRGPVLLLRVGDQRSAVQVDAVIGQEEIVVKSLGDVLTGHPLFAGVTIRGSGDLVLIFDVPALLGGGRDPAKEDRAPDGREADGSGRVEPGSGREAGDASALTAAKTAPIAEAPARPRAPIDEPVAPSTRGRLRVLFVDDSLSVRKVAEKTLESLGAEVWLAVDGLDALSKLREQTVDIVFTDLEMPRMHGYDLIRELRFIPAHAEMPIVVVSSRSAQKHQEQAKALGASGYITKPFTAQALDTALTRWGRGKHRAGGGGQDPGR